MLRGREYIKMMIDTVLSHVEERCEADQGKASTDQRDKRNSEGRVKQPGERQKGGVISAISGVCFGENMLLESVGGEAQMRICSCGMQE